MAVPCKHPGSSRTSTIISSAGIVERHRPAHEAPRLVEAQVSDRIEELLPLVVECVGTDPKCTSLGEIYRGPATAGIALAVIFEREARRQTAAELPCVSGAYDAVRLSLAAKPLPPARLGSVDAHPDEP